MVVDITTNTLTCGQCGSVEPKKKWKRHFDRQHGGMRPFALKEGEEPVDPDFKPRKGGNYATGSERQSQRVAQSHVEVISDQELDDLRS